MRSEVPGPDDVCIARIQSALGDDRLDAVLCALPSNVLLLSGYWPVMGTSVAVATREGAVHLLLPEDEAEIASTMSTGEQTTFQPGSLEAVTNAGRAIREPLAKILRSLRLEHGKLGVETDPAALPVSYLSQYHYGGALRESLAGLFPQMHLVPADALLKRLRAVKTTAQLQRLRISCALAGNAYLAGSEQLRLQIGGGLREPAAAHLFHAAFAEAGERGWICRSGSYFFCMSGPDSASASAAFARTRTRAIEEGDLVMIHCNSQADGYWTDITRTFCNGEPTAKQHAMRAAILEARAAALASIAPGARACDVDKAARDVMSAHGFEKAFRHSTGHGVGFSAANHDAIPRIHPKSTDVLEEGMTFNVEPAAYFDGYGGMRHCDVVAVTSTGVEVLTDFQNTEESLTIQSGQSNRSVISAAESQSR